MAKLFCVVNAVYVVCKNEILSFINAHITDIINDISNTINDINDKKTTNTITKASRSETVLLKRKIACLQKNMLAQNHFNHCA